MSSYDHDDYEPFGVPSLVIWIVAIIGIVILFGAGLHIYATAVRVQTDEVIRPMEITDFDSRMNMSEKLNTVYQSLIAAKATMSTVTEDIAAMEALYGPDMQAWPLDKKEEYIQLTKLLRDYTSSYNQACARYQATWADDYQNVAAPKDLPRDCTLVSALAQ